MTDIADSVSYDKKVKLRTQRMNYLRKSWQLYLMLVPVLLYYAVFSFGAYPGLMMAFQNYKISAGLFASEFVGLKHFNVIFQSAGFAKILRNTIFLNLLNLVLYFPAPIILALMLNEVKHTSYKRISQSLMYLPHFFSWIVLGGMITQILSPSRGVVNLILEGITGETIFFMANKTIWPFIFVLSSMWKEVGWGTIIYLAAISGIDPELYEAATIDGAGHFRQVLNITIPSISHTIIILLILRMGSVLNVGIEQIMALSNAAVSEISDVIATYTYRMGVQNGQYSFTTAIGIFSSVVSLIMLLLANWFAKKYSESSIF